MVEKERASDIFIKIDYNVAGHNEPKVPKVFITDPEFRKYVVKLKDGEKEIDEAVINSNEWFAGMIWWYVDWHVEIYDMEMNLLYHDHLELEDKLIRVIINSDSIGDTIAWFPYVEEFRKKHKCRIICQTNFGWMFEENYPEIVFVPRTTQTTNTYITYVLGTTFDEDRKYNFPSTFIDTPMQKCATDVLGLPFKEIKPEMFRSLKRRMIEDKYVCFSPHSQGRQKYWNYPGGWQKVIDYIKSRGIQVMGISKERCNYDGIIDMTGDHPLQDRVNQLENCEFYMGISSGLSWLSWAVGKHSFLVSDCTPPWSEFQSNVTRLYNKEHVAKKVSYAEPKHPVDVDEVITAIGKYMDANNIGVEKEKVENKFKDIAVRKDFKMLIPVMVYNRKAVVETCLGDFRLKQNSADKMIAYDDHSDEFDLKWLSQYFDKVIKLPKKSGLIHLRIQSLLHFLKQREYDFLYFTDTDAFYDPSWRERLLDLYYLDIDGKHRRPVCLYNSAFHGNSTKKIYYEKKIFLRRTAPGISMLLDREMAEIIWSKLKGLSNIEIMWDYLFIDMLQRYVITSDESYVEHFNFGGVHNRNPEQDRAVNPTQYLRTCRNDVLNKIQRLQRKYLTDYIKSDKKDLSKDNRNMR